MKGLLLIRKYFNNFVSFYKNNNTFASVLVSPLPIPLEKSDEKGNQVQVLNRPAAVNPFKIFEYSISH